MELKKTQLMRKTTSEGKITKRRHRNRGKGGQSGKCN